MVTATPLGCKTCIIVFAICIVKRSCVCNLLEKASTTRANLLKPTTFIEGM